MSDLAFDKEFAGSMKYGINNNVHNVRANHVHVDNRDDNGIAGGVCNVLYFPSSMSKERIETNYMFLKNNNPPIV